MRCVIALLLLFMSISSTNSLKVGIIGGGVAGLSCARQLASLGIESSVFDTGKVYPGGRCSSRVVKIGGDEIVIDHSTQFFTAKSEAFRDFLVSSNDVAIWRGQFGSISNERKFAAIPTELDRYVGVNGVRSFVTSLSANLNVKNPTWVSKMIKNNDESWSLFEFNKPLGTFDFIVIAHNGKCADKLLSSTSSHRVHDLLKVSFGSKIASIESMRKMQLCSLWAMMLIVPRSLGLSLDAASVDGSDVLSFVSCTTTKLCNSRSVAEAGDKPDNGAEAWTLVSTREFGSEYKCPQENIPTSREAEVKELMLAEFARVLSPSADQKTCCRTSCSVKFSCGVQPSHLTVTHLTAF